MRASCETRVLQKDDLPEPNKPRLSYLERLVQMLEPVSRAATLLGISRQRVLQLIQSGDLEAVKIGSDWFVSSLSVQERINAQRKF